MNETSTDDDQPVDRRDRQHEELVREHQLVRSTGTISKSTMATAFGVVLLLIAALVATPLLEWGWAYLLAATGVSLVIWAVVARTRASGRQKT